MKINHRLEPCITRLRRPGGRRDVRRGRLAVCSLLTRLPILFVLTVCTPTGPAVAIEAPLTRASFDRAIEEGRTLEDWHDVGPPLVGSARVAGAFLQNLLEGLLGGDLTDAAALIFVETPYVRARVAAWDARVRRKDLDVEALWTSLQSDRRVRLYATFIAGVWEGAQRDGPDSSLGNLNTRSFPVREVVLHLRAKDRAVTDVQPLAEPVPSVGRELCKRRNWLCTREQSVLEFPADVFANGERIRASVVAAGYRTEVRLKHRVLDRP